MAPQSSRRLFKGPVRACVFDWAGTTIDYGCRAPAVVFREAFAAFDVEITEAEAREPMGLPKKDHIRAIGGMPAVAARWQAIRGHPFAESDVEALYQRFLSRQIEVVGSYADVIPGVADAIIRLRERGIRIGSTTGYTRDIMAACCGRARAQGYVPEVMMCTGDGPRGRPAPDLLWRAMMELAVFPPAAVVKVGDTVADIEEGLNAGTWTVGCALTGSEMGLSLAEVESLPSAERSARRDRAAAKLTRAGAHFVIDGVADLPPLIDTINHRLEAGERP